MSKKRLRLQITGNPEKLVEVIVGELVKRARSKVDEAYKAAREILDNAYKEALQELEDSIKSELENARENILATEASEIVELRKELTKLRLEYVEKVLSEAFRKFRLEIPIDNYVAFIKRHYEAALNSMKRYTREAIILPCSNDLDVLKRIVENTPSEEVQVEVLTNTTMSCYGGFIIQSRDGRIRLDYRLEALLGRIIDELRSIALKELFSS
ncbi:MAG: V-type ATP synthase subunit E family protein [Pyrodictiaceae archaeon]